MPIENNFGMEILRLVASWFHRFRQYGEGKFALEVRIRSEVFLDGR
jgi:hypothetical protein